MSQEAAAATNNSSSQSKAGMCLGSGCAACAAPPLAQACQTAPPARTPASSSSWVACCFVTCMNMVLHGVKQREPALMCAHNTQSCTKAHLPHQALHAELVPPVLNMSPRPADGHECGTFLLWKQAMGSGRLIKNGLFETAGWFGVVRHALHRTACLAPASPRQHWRIFRTLAPLT